MYNTLTYRIVPIVCQILGQDSFLHSFLSKPCPTKIKRKKMSKALEIIGFSGYFITNTGSVYSRINKQNRIKRLHPPKTRVGYYQVGLRKDGKRYFIGVHRLVAQAFIPNPENKSCINHINGIRTDNRVENLEWCTYSENMKHSYSVLHRPSGKRKATKNEYKHHKSSV